MQNHAHKRHPPDSREDDDVYRKRPMGPDDMPAIAEAIYRRHWNKTSGSTPPALYGVYSRHSEAAHKLLKGLNDLPPVSPVGETYTVQSLLTPNLTRLIQRDFPDRIDTLIETLATRGYQRTTPAETWYLRHAMTNSGAVGFAVYHEVSAQLGSSLADLVATRTDRRVRHVAVGNLRHQVQHFIEEPLSTMQCRQLYRESNPHSGLPLVSVEGGASLEMALDRAVDLANNRASLSTPRRAVLAASASQ